MTKNERKPTIKACVKRLNNICIEELTNLSLRDLQHILNLTDCMNLIRRELIQRSVFSNLPKTEDSHVHEHAAA